MRTFRTYERIGDEALEAEQMARAHGDVELREMAKEEAIALRLQQTELLHQLEQFWEEEHGESDRPILVELRAATGGLESG